MSNGHAEIARWKRSSISPTGARRGSGTGESASHAREMLGLLATVRYYAVSNTVLHLHVAFSNDYGNLENAAGHDGCLDCIVKCLRDKFGVNALFELPLMFISAVLSMLGPIGGLLGAFIGRFWFHTNPIEDWNEPVLDYRTM